MFAKGCGGACAPRPGLDLHDSQGPRSYSSLLYIILFTCNVHVHRSGLGESAGRAGRGGARERGGISTTWIRVISVIRVIRARDGARVDTKLGQFFADFPIDVGLDALLNEPFPGTALA